jgi:hypothetical protein
MPLNMFGINDQLIDACDVTLSVYPHRASLKNMPDHSGDRTYEHITIQLGWLCR